MWIQFNENPAGLNVGDCAVMAISVALSVNWETAYAMLVAAGYWMCDMPSSDAVWGSGSAKERLHPAVHPGHLS